MSPLYRDAKEEKRLVVVLTPAESKKLLGLAVRELPAVKRAMKCGTVIVATGGTNAYVKDALTGTSSDPRDFLTGHIIDGGFGVNIRKRATPLVLYRGQVTDTPWLEAVTELGANDVVIKGANAVDPMGHAGILLLSPEAGTIGKLVGVTSARGISLIIPVGLEKLIPSVLEAANCSGLERIEHSLDGRSVGLMPVVNGQVVTEVEAFKILFDVRACPIAAGGIAGSEGAVTLVVQGEEEQIVKAKEMLKDIKGEPPMARP